MKITKNLEISTGHRLHLHNGGCSNFHGHNYQIQTTIEFIGLKDEYIQSVGFLIDFKEIKGVLNSNYDHQFLIYKGDPLCDQSLTLPGIRIVDFAPTAENIAKEMVEKIGEKLTETVDASILNEFNVTIQLHETSTAYVETHKTFSLKK